MKALIKELKDKAIPFEQNVSLKEKTWIKTGGVVSLWIVPNNEDQLKSAITTLLEYNRSFELVGQTSNLYYLDDYNPAIIVSTLKVNEIEEKDDCIKCGCGASVVKLSRHCVEKGYIGYCGLVNLPGTVGAAIYNSSSCFDCSISEHVVDASFFNMETKQIETLMCDDFGFTYRNSKLKKKELKGVLLSVRLNKKQGDPVTEKAKADEATRIRKETQEPGAYTLGSCYAGLTPKDDIRNTICRIGGGKLLKLLGLYTKKRYIKILLSIYGYRDLIDFVSPKVINTFKWLPERPEKHEMFKRYQSFIAKAFKQPRLEIEIRNGK